MMPLERLLIEFLLNFLTREELNAFLRSPQNTATLVGGLIAVSGALLGAFLLLRGMALTSDAISHTVLLGIVVAFLLMVHVFRVEGDTSSPWLILGASVAGVGTVVLTEMLYRSGLVRQDAALGLAFPLLFAIAVILVSRYVDDAHLDEDAVLVGEIGLAWANTNSHCFENCQSVTVTESHPAAKMTRQCVNCRELGISPRDERAEFIEVVRQLWRLLAGASLERGLAGAETGAGILSQVDFGGAGDDAADAGFRAALLQRTEALHIRPGIGESARFPPGRAELCLDGARQFGGGRRL